MLGSTVLRITGNELIGLVSVVGVLFGVPSMILAWQSLRRRRYEELARRVTKYVTGQDPDDIDWPTPEHPSLPDMLAEIRDNTSEVASVSSLLAQHMADGHGPAVGFIPRRRA